MKLAIIDLDGVVADNTARFAKAEEVKQATWNDRSVQLGERQKTSVERFWQTAFTPELVALDTLIEGAVDAIFEIEKRYQVIYLTSRPETMRKATYDWLFEQELSGPDVVMKAPAFQYVKTVVWKAGMVQTLASLYDAKNVLFINDEQANRDAVMNAFLGSGLSDLIVASSLADAVEKLKEDEDE